MVHPVTPEHDPVGVARVILDSGIWTSVHFVIVLGIVLMHGGLIAIYNCASFTLLTSSPRPT
jgi:hypothetical protein